MRGLRGPTGQAGVLGQFSILADPDALKTVTTVGISNVGYFVLEGGSTTIWRLAAGTAVDGDGVRRPNDYVDVTNEKNFIRDI